MSQADGEQIQGGQLGDEGFGGGHPDFRAGVGVDDTACFTGNGGIHDVADGHDHGAACLCLPQGRQGIGGLARLGDDHDQGVLVDDRVAVAELGGNIDLDRDAAAALDVEFSDQRGVPGGAAGNDNHALDACQLAVTEGQVFQVYVAFSLQQTTGDGVAHGPGLFVDLFEHEVLG